MEKSSNEVKAESPLESAIGQIEAGLTHLNEAIVKLQGRLSSVLREEEAIDEDPSPDKTGSSGESLVVTTITSQANSLERSTDRILLLINRLDV